MHSAITTNILREKLGGFHMLYTGKVVLAVNNMQRKYFSSLTHSTAAIVSKLSHREQIE